MRGSQLRIAVCELVDALGYPILVGDPKGQVLHETPALRAVLEAEPDAELLRAAMESLLEPEPGPERPPGGDGADAAAPPARREVQTRNGRYLLRSSVYVCSTIKSPPLVLVRVDRPVVDSRSEADLREIFSLTPTEVRVALLLARGMSNAEIAAQLVISPHTARRHTESVLRKLEIRSRSEVATRLLS